MNGNKNLENDEPGEFVSFDKAITLAGFGRLQCEIVVACAVIILAVGFQNGLPGYVFPAAQCELGLTSSQIGFLNVAFLIGGTSSAFFWGVLADVKGRRSVLIASLLLDFVITAFCSAVNNFYELLICRLLSGFFMGAPGSITFSYLAECQPPGLRNKSVCYSGVFFALAWLLLPLLARVTLPLNFGLVYIFKSWRLLLLFLSLPEFLAVLWLMRLPESPKFLVSRGNTLGALDILKRIHSSNKRKRGEYPVKNIYSEIKLNDRMNTNVKYRRKVVRIVVDIYDQIKGLFQKPLAGLTTLICTIMFCNMFGFFGLGLWLPELFNRFERFQMENPNKTISVKELSLLKMPTQGNITNCSVSFGGSAFESTAYIGASALFGNLLSGWLAGKLALKVMPLVSMGLATVSAGSIYWLRSSLQNMIVACIFQSAMAIANVTIGSVAVELFPTSVNAMAICLVMCAGRIGAICSNITFGYLMDKHCEIPIFLVATVALFGTILCLLIRPKKIKQQLHDATNENNKKESEVYVIGKKSNTVQ